MSYIQPKYCPGPPYGCPPYTLHARTTPISTRASSSIVSPWLTTPFATCASRPWYSPRTPSSSCTRAWCQMSRMVGVLLLRVQLWAERAVWMRVLARMSG